MQISDKNKDVKGLVLLAVICLVLQLALAPNIGLGNGRANFALIFVAVIALSQGGGNAVIAGFVAGLLFDLSSTGPIGLMAFCLSVTGLVLGGEGRNRMAGDFGGSVVYTALASLGVSLVYSIAMLASGQTSSFVDAIFLRALPTTLLTLVAFLPFAYYYSRIKSSGPNLGGRGGHFKRSL